MMLQVGDKIEITQADDVPRRYVMLGKAFYSEFTGEGFKGCYRGKLLGSVHWLVYGLQLNLERLVHGEAKHATEQRTNIDCMLEQVFAENLV